MIRKGTAADIDAIEKTYTELLRHEAATISHTGWKEGMYPVRAVAEKALAAGYLYVLEDHGEICASMVLNHLQLDEYGKIDWHYPASGDEVLVIHTLCIPPSKSHHGYGRQMVQYYIDMGHQLGCKVLRLDTGLTNKPARALYEHMGFVYAGQCASLFQGVIPTTLIFLDYKLTE